MTNDSNKKLVPEAMDSLEKFKYEVANDAGKIGGNMVKKMIQQAENSMINK